VNNPKGALQDMENPEPLEKLERLANSGAELIAKHNTLYHPEVKDVLNGININSGLTEEAFKLKV
jgi:hypothetical protein